VSVQTVLAVVAGSLLVLLMLWDAFQTMVLSRRVAPRFRPTRVFYRVLWTAWRAATRRVPPGRRRENVLMIFGPMALLLLIATWAFGLVLGFALLHWGVGSHMRGPHDTSGFGLDLYASATTFFTLGLGDVVPQTPLARALTALECGLGFAFLAVVIGYVPLISQAFSRREVSISMLDARAGSPPSAGRLLQRHFRSGGEEFRELLRDWERWSAELLESHVSFAALCYFRSQHDDQSWVAALTTILDVCALLVARIEHESAVTARVTFAMARHAVVDLCSIFALKPVKPFVDRLSGTEEQQLASLLAAEGVRLRSDDASLQKLIALRLTYEPYVQALANFLVMPLPGWLPSTRESESWHVMT
jgi:hypothetical protein